MANKIKKILVIPIIVMFLMQVMVFQPTAAYTSTESIAADIYIGWQNNGSVYTDQTNSPVRDIYGNIVSYIGSSILYGTLEEGAALKFNLSSVKGNITSATLKINVSEVNGKTILNLIKLVDDSWNTSSAYKPSYNTADIVNGYSKYNITSTGIQSFNVTNYVQDEQKGDSIASFALTGLNDNGDNDFAFICDPNSPNRPVLEITYAPYNVTFDSQGGSAVLGISGDYNNTISAPNPPTREGFSFGGWYKEASCTNAWNFTADKVTTNTTLYAKWNPVIYNVTFDSQGGSAVLGISTNYKNTILSPIPPVKEGYTFNGWYKEAACINPWNFDTDRVTSDTKLYAKWVINKYTVNFDSEGEVSTQTVDYNCLITAPTAPTKTGYTFGGWYKEASCTNAWNFTTEKVTTNITLYAKLIPVIYNITFDSQDGSPVLGISTIYNNTISSPNPLTREGYTFDGWYKESACINPWNFDTDRVTVDTKLYAKWVINKYTVNFDSQGGNELSTKIVDYNSLITVPTAPTKTRCTFGGWYKEAECINEWNFTQDNIIANTTLYAKWMKNEDINQDGAVNIIDLAEIAKNYNSKSGQTNWNVDYDLNNDKIVDIYDLVLVSILMN